MNLRPDEINKLIKEQIRNYEGRLETAQYGTVVQVGDGIARVYGLDNAMASLLSSPERFTAWFRTLKRTT